MSVQATIHHGSVPAILSGPSPSIGPRGALDSMSYELLTSIANWLTDADDLGFQQDFPIPGHPRMWVQSLAREEQNDLVATVRVQCVGLYTGDEKRRRGMSVAGREIAIGPDEVVVLAWSTEEQGEEVGGDPLTEVKRRVPKLDSFGDPVYKTITTPIGTGPRWNVREAIVVVTDTYFTTAEPDMAVAGTAYAPPNAPTPPPFVWGGYTEPMRANFPAGWVLDGRKVVEHFRISATSGLWEVTDTTGYYYIAAPD